MAASIESFLYQLEFTCAGNGLNAVVYTQLAENIMIVRFHGAETKKQTISNRLVAVSVRQQQQDFLFALR